MRPSLDCNRKNEVTDLPGHGVTVSTCGSNPPSLCSNQSAPAIYIDDETGT